jgi:O-antigen/teichoic acid export membrane protein
MSARPAFNFNPDASSGLRRHATRSAGLTIGAQGIKFALRLGSMTLLARLLSPNDYGVVAMAMAVTGVLASLREAGLSSATIQRPEISHTQVSTLFWLNCLLGLVVALLCVALAPVAAWFFNHQELLLVIPALGFSGLIGSIGIQHNALMQRRMEFKQLMLRDLAGQAGGFIAGYTAARLGAGYWSLVVMETATVIISTVAIWLGCPWRPSRPGAFADVKPLVNFGANVSGAALITHFTGGLNTMVLGYFHGPAAVGLYTRAQQLLSTPMGQVVTPLMSVARPALSRAAEDPTKLARVTGELMGLISFACAGIIAMLVPAADGIILLLMGERWLAAAPIFVALAPFAIIEPAAGMLASVLVASGHAAAMLRWRVVSLLVIVAGLALSVHWGPVAVAATYAGLGLFVRMPQFMWLVCRKTGTSFRLLLSTMVPSLLTCAAAIAGACGVRQLFPHPERPLVASLLALVAGAIYLGLNLATRPGRARFASIRQLVASTRAKPAKKTAAPNPPSPLPSS